MSDKFFAAVAILILGFFLYAFSTVQNTNSSLLGQVAQQQSQVLVLMETKLSQHSPAVSPSAEAGGLQGRLQALEARLAELETDTKPIVTQIKAQQKAQQEYEEAMKKVYDIEIGNSPVRGNKDAAITLVEFTDFQCPYCGRFNNIQAEVLAAYPDKVKFVLKNFPLPFHPQARPAAKAVLAAGLQGKYWEMSDAILKDNSNLSNEKYEELAKNIGLKLDKFRRDLKEHDADFEKTLQADMALAQKVFVRGTPAFYLNGKMTMPDMQNLKATIDQLIKQ